MGHHSLSKFGSLRKSARKFSEPTQVPPVGPRDREAASRQRSRYVSILPDIPTTLSGSFALEDSAVLPRGVMNEQQGQCQQLPQPASFQVLLDRDDDGDVDPSTM